MLDFEQIEKMFDSLSDDVFELCDAYGFLSTLQYKRDLEKYPAEVSTPQQGLYGLTLRFAHVSLFIAVGRLMDKDDKKSYSLAYAIRQLELYKPGIEHLTNIWGSKMENWSRRSSGAQPSAGQLDTIRDEYQKQIGRCNGLFETLKEDYEPIKKMRDKYYAHTSRAHANREEPLSLEVIELDKFVEDLKEIFNELSGTFRNGIYAFSLDQGVSAAEEMLWLKRNERLDLGLSIRARNKEIGMDDKEVRDVVEDFYKRSEPFKHEPHKSVLEALAEEMRKMRAGQSSS
jgi:AbiU2